jgi:hypothetical protein
MYTDSIAQKLSPVAGFSLIELHLYITIMAIMVIMVCHIALQYHSLYDKTETFTQAVMQQKKEINFSPGSFLKKGKLLAGTGKQKMVLLENVAAFDIVLDMKDKMVSGSTFTCAYGTRTVSWYHAAPTKAFSCSYSL